MLEEGAWAESELVDATLSCSLTRAPQTDCEAVGSDISLIGMNTLQAPSGCEYAPCKGEEVQWFF